MLSVFLIVYAANGGIGAVSYPLMDMEQCQSIVDHRIDQQENYLENVPDGPRYTFKCEEHKLRPKVTTKIDPKDRTMYESQCFNILGMPAHCEDLPNSDSIIKQKDLH